MASMRGLAAKATALGVEIVTGVDGDGLRRQRQPRRSGGRDVAGTIAATKSSSAWAVDQFDLEHAGAAEDHQRQGRDGKVHDGVRMWHYMALQEGTLGVDPEYQKTNDGRMPPVIHVDTDAPLRSDRDGHLITDKLWGLYYKARLPFRRCAGRRDARGGDARPPTTCASTRTVRSRRSSSSPTTSPTCGLPRSRSANKRFEGQHPKYKSEPSGGIGCFTPDSFPVFDRFRENVYVIADSNHGFKMIGVGELVAAELLGEKRALLEPFRFARYAAGRLHPVSNSPFPWS
jgi:glycine/D-amino acid oxidase-like deaminating enzyme